MYGLKAVVQGDSRIALLAMKLRLAVWKNLVIGGQPLEDLLVTLSRKRIFITEWAERMMLSNEFPRLSTPRTVVLVKATVAELGFPKGADIHMIRGRAMQLDLERCPPEVGPYLRMEILKQAVMEDIEIAMDPIYCDNFGNGAFLLLNNGKKRALSARTASSLSERSSDDTFVFAVHGGVY